MTEKLYYDNAYLKDFEAAVVSCERKGDKWLTVLDRTCFYPEGGGQPADHGYLGGAAVLDVHDVGGEIVHTTDAELIPGTAVRGTIDWDRRFDHMQQHSGEHIVSGMLCSAYGCNNVGFHMGSEIIQIDYDTDISWEDVLETERKANRYLWEDHKVSITWPDKEKLAALEYRSKKELTGAVRITEWPGADVCACCGTHVASSGEVGLVKMLSVQKIKEGVRIELLCGKRAMDYLAQIWDQNQEVSRALSARPAATAEAVVKLKEENYRLKGACTALEEKLFGYMADEYRGSRDPVVFTGPLGSDGVRKLCDMLSESAEGRCCVFAGTDGEYKYAVIDRGKDIRELIRTMNAALGGRGGGKDGFAQGNLTSNKAEILEFFSKMPNTQ